jgi:hypothetical protein
VEMAANAAARVSRDAAPLALVGGPGEDRFPWPAVFRRFLTRALEADSGGTPPHASNSPPEAKAHRH